MLKCLALGHLRPWTVPVCMLQVVSIQFAPVITQVRQKKQGHTYGVLHEMTTDDVRRAFAGPQVQADC